MKPTETKHIKSRAIVIGIFFSLFFTAIVAKAVYLQIFHGPSLSRKAADQYESSSKSTGKRGTIYDTRLAKMAVSIDVTSIAAYPPRIEDVRAAAKSLAKILKINLKALQGRLSSEKKFVWVKRHAAPKETLAVRNLNIAGIDFITEHKRFYPNKTLAAQVLGFTNIDDIGLEGIEFYYNNYLQGASGSFTVIKDALGRGFEAQDNQLSNYSGNNLILTLDRTIQYIAEKTLEETVNKYAARSGIVIVMAPETGALLAVVHYPFFNPNAFSGFSQEDWRNRSITDPFEPGSTMKIFSAAAALESGSSTPNSSYFCENGAYKIGKDVVHDTHSYGWLTLPQIIKLSSNIGAVKLSEITGSEALYKILKDFGFGTKTGINCPGETVGSLSHYNRWSKIDTGTIAFGQGIAVSALQLITAVSAIANGGMLMKPYIVQAITDQNGVPVETFGPKTIRRAVSATTAKTINRIMQTVIAKGGTGVNAALERYSAAGKTGTAQKIDEQGEYTKGKYTASFVGFAPAEKPKVAILVVIDEPPREHYGGIVAAPAFRKIANKTLDYMNIPSETKTDKLTASLENEA